MPRVPSVLLVATLSLVISSNSIRAEAPAVKPSSVKPTAAQLRDWMDELNSDDFRLRERAQQRLIEAGGAAVPTLSQGLMSDNPEIAWRCGETIERIALEGDEATLDRVSKLLQEMSKKGRRSLGVLASELQDRQKTFRHDRAVSHFRKLGGRVGAAFDSEIADVDVMVGPVDIEGILVEDVELAADDVAEIAPESAPPPLVEKVEKFEKALDAVAEALLPGRVGKIVGRAVGLGGEPEAVPEEDAPPAVAVDPVAPLPGDDAPPAAEADKDVVEDFAIELAPAVVRFGGLDVGPDYGVAQGMMQLPATWKGGDEGLSVVKDLQEITSMQIEGADISDAALDHIAKLRKLRHIQIRGTRFTTDGLRKFREKRADVSIMAMGNAMMGVSADWSRDTCVLNHVFPGSGASDGGLREGDEITAINGRAVRDFSDLTVTVFNCQPGDKLKVAFRRDGETREADVVLKARAG